MTGKLPIRTCMICGVESYRSPCASCVKKIDRMMICIRAWKVGGRCYFCGEFTEVFEGNMFYNRSHVGETMQGWTPIKVCPDCIKRENRRKDE